MDTVMKGKPTSILIIISILQGIQSVSIEHKTEVNATVGQNISLPCIMPEKHPKILQLQWHKEGKHGQQKFVTFNPTFSTYYHANVTLQLVPETNSADIRGSILHLQHVTDGDSGEYVCDIASFPDGSIKSSTKVQITEIECMVVNLEYMNCTWNGNGTLSENLSFKSSYKSSDSSQTDPVECTSYLYVGALRVGCMVPYSEEKLLRFRDFYAWLYRDDDIIAKQEYKPLTSRVKLYPPHNVSLVLRDPELWIYWNITSNIKFTCQDREVRYRINGKQWNDQGRIMENAFNVPLANAQRLYEVQVRVRISSNCGQSDLWSDWSEPVSWGSMKKLNDTVVTKVDNVQHELYMCLQSTT